MDRREAIIDAAVTLFHQQGYANTSMQDIADAVGLLKGSLYYLNLAPISGSLLKLPDLDNQR